MGNGGGSPSERAVVLTGVKTTVLLVAVFLRPDAESKHMQQMGCLDQTIESMDSVSNDLEITTSA